MTPSVPVQKGLYIKTYGCQMNIYDSQRMEASLHPLGFETVSAPELADLMIINTCHIRAKAEDKLFSELGRLKAVKLQRQEEGFHPIIVVAGCIGQALGKSILERTPYVDVVVGPQTYHSLPETVMRILRAQGQHVVLGFPKMEKFDYLPQERAVQGANAFLTIQEGCNKFCRYCVVPYTRGPEYSRPMADVLSEAQLLVNAGAREITLLGQNVNAYHGQYQGGTGSLGSLIQQLQGIKGLKRLRYMTSHPKDVDIHLLEAHGTVDMLMPLLHLPVQSGSNRILAHMNRKHTREFYLEIVEKFHKHQPNLRFSSDFIVGYPTETERDFQDTCDLVRQVDFVQAFSFKYSPRPGTPAALDVQLPESVKSERLQHLQELLLSQREKFNRGFLGQSVEVLLEGEKSKKENDVRVWMGKSPFMHTVYVKGGNFQTGDMVMVKIDHASPYNLTGTAIV